MSESAQKDYSTAFRLMADRIDLNAGQGFAGAFVLMPPDGEAIQTLLLDNIGHAAVFWSMLKTQCQMALDDIDQKERMGKFGR